MKNISIIVLLFVIHVVATAQSTDKFKKTTRNLDVSKISGSFTTISGISTKASNSPKSFALNIGKKKSLLLSDTPIILSRNVISGLPTFIKKYNSPTAAVFKPIEIIEDVKNTERVIYDGIKELTDPLQISDPQTQFKMIEVEKDTNGILHAKLKQQINNIDIYGAEILVHINNKESSLTLNGNYYKFNRKELPNSSIDNSSLINTIENDLIDLKKRSISKSNFIKEFLPPIIEKIILPNQDLQSGKIAYHITYWASPTSRWEYFIDASMGNIIRSFENRCSADGPINSSGKDLNGVTRTFGTYLSAGSYYMVDITKPMFSSSTFKGIIKTYDMKNDTVGTLYTVTSSNNTWDPKAVSAHFNASISYDYFKNIHGRNSIDNKGMDILSVVNVPDFENGKSLENAFWNGKFMCYGNGGKVFKPLAGSKDVASHEMTHGVVQFSANLEYEAQPGAINESMADIFGFMVDTTNWLIGEEIILDKTYFPSGALRSLSDPHNGGKNLNDPCFQPKNMSEYFTGEADNYGVHVNSGIPNHAFYLIANNPLVGKIKAAKIYYQALTKYLVKLSQFLDLRLAVIQSAKDLYSATEADVVAKAFDAVGIIEASTLEKVSDLKTNPGTEYLLTYDTDKSDPNGIYRRTSSGTSTKELTNKTVGSKPSITDNGKIAVFIGTDRKMYSLTVDPSVATEKTVIQSEDIWANVAISKDGKRLAAVTKSQDTSIWVYDYGKKAWYRYMLYSPTFTSGVKAPGPLYADGIDWDYTGQNLVFDCFNKIKDASGNDISYWDINMINVWNNSSNSSTEGKISKLFSLSEGDNIGNPTFSKNSPQKIAFDYFNDIEELYGVIGYDIAENLIDVIAVNNTLGFPTYDKLDGRIAFATDSSGIDVVKYVNLNKDKISSNDTPKKLVNWGKWPVFYTVGNRNVVIPPTPVITTGGATIICTGQSVTLTSSSATGNQWYKNGGKISNAISKTYQVTESGSYSVIVIQDSVPSAPSSAITVIANATPAKPSISRDANGFLVSSSLTNNQWVKESTTLSDTAQKYKPVSSGYYAVKVSRNGCSSALSDSYYYLTSAIPNNTYNRTLKIYPNPNKGEFYVKGISNTNEIFVSITELSGKTVVSNKKYLNSSKISTQILPRGTYIIQITDKVGKLLSTQKLIKE